MEFLWAWDSLHRTFIVPKHLAEVDSKINFCSFQPCSHKQSLSLPPGVSISKLPGLWDNPTTTYWAHTRYKTLLEDARVIKLSKTVPDFKENFSKDYKLAKQGIFKNFNWLFKRVILKINLYVFTYCIYYTFHQPFHVLELSSGQLCYFSGSGRHLN